MCAVAALPSLKQLEEALELDPRSPILHYNMGQAREVIGEMEGAIAEYKLSLDNDIRYMDGAPQFVCLGLLSANKTDTVITMILQRAVSAQPTIV